MNFNKYFKRDVLTVEGAPADGGGAPPEAPAPEPTPAPSTPPLQAPSTSPDWSAIKAGMAEELRSDSSLEPITSVEGLVKGYIHGQKAIGKDKIVMPDKHATKDDYLNIFRKLGSPESLEEYKISVENQDANPDFFNGFRESAHKAGLLPWQAEEVISFVMDNATTSISKQEEAFVAKIEEDLKGLKSEWGESYEDKVQRANLAFKEHIPNEAERKALIDQGFGSNVALIKLMERLANGMTEDQFIGQGNGKFGKMSPAEAESKAKDIMGDQNHPARNTQHPNHESAKKELSDLWRVAYPE